MSWMSKNLYQVTATPCARSPKLEHKPIGTYMGKAKIEHFDFVVIIVKMCFNEPKTNLHDT